MKQWLRRGVALVLAALTLVTVAAASDGSETRSGSAAKWLLQWSLGDWLPADGLSLPAMLALCGTALLLMVLLFHYTRFGYDYRALQTGQRIAVNTGVRERANALGCYTLSGALFGAAGAVSLCSTNGVTPTINFSTIASMFACFLPLFFSGFIVKFCNKQLAILLGCIGYEFIQIGFGQLSFTVAAFTSDVYRVIEAGILVLFLIYLNNEGIITDILTMRRRRQNLPQKETSA